MDSKQIIDTLSMVREVLTKTETKAEYLKARDLRPIVSALVNPADETKATITFGAITDHLKWTEIRYKKLSNPGEWHTMRIENWQNEALCEDFARNVAIQIRCAYNPPTTDEEYVGDWEDYEPFILKYDPSDWVVIPRHGSHEWSDGKGSQDLWSGGHPMLIFDSDAGSGWHSVLSTALPQVLIVDMKEPRKINEVFIGDGSYWINVELYFTDDLSIPNYETHHVNWDDPSREQSYNDWVGQYVSKVPATVPESWGTPIVRSNNNTKGETFLLPSTVEKRFLIVRFPDSTDGGNYIGVNTLAVYSN